MGFIRKILSLALAALLLTAGSLSAKSGANTSLPVKPDTLRILAIGNSFADDGMMWLPELLEAASIRNVILGRLYIGGCSLERHCNEHEGGETDYIYYKSTKNKWETISKKASMLQGLKDEKWDIISLQQASGWSGMYSSYNPWLGKLIGIVREHSAKKEARIAWHQTWAYARNSTHEHFSNYGKDQIKMFSAINECVEKLRQEYGIEVVIPSGTTIQLFRETPLNDINELTRDGYHLNEQFGRYAAACAWFEALIKPVFGISVRGNPCTLAGIGHQLCKGDAKKCQSAAVKAARSFRQASL